MPSSFANALQFGGGGGGAFDPQNLYQGSGFNGQGGSFNFQGRGHGGGSDFLGNGQGGGFIFQGSGQGGGFAFKDNGNGGGGFQRFSMQQQQQHSQQGAAAAPQSQRRSFFSETGSDHTLRPVTFQTADGRFFEAVERLPQFGSPSRSPQGHFAGDGFPHQSDDPGNA